VQNAIELCAEYPDQGPGETLAGDLDHVTILGSALSAAVIADLHDGDLTLGDLLGEPDRDPIGSWQFDEAAGNLVAQDELGWHHGIYDGAASGATADDGSGAATFDGSDNQVFLGPVGVYTGQITMLARLKVDAFQDVMQIACNATSSNTYWSLRVDGPERRLRFTIRTWFGGNNELKSPNDTLVAGQWIDVAAVYSGSQMTLYADGVLVGQKSLFGYLASTPFADLSIGCRPPGSPRARYLRDLRLLQASGAPDQRPFDGPLSINPGMVSAATVSLLKQDLGIEVQKLAAASGPPVAHPGQVSQYQLYPGGEVYAAVELAGSLADAQLGPDPRTNPLGLFVCTDELRLGDNVTISGTLLTYRDSTAGDIRVTGDNVTLRAVDLPPLVGATEPRQLPVAIVNNDFEIDDNSSGSLDGLAVTWDDFRFHGGGAGTKFNVVGKLIVSEIQLEARSDWDQGSSWWSSRMSEFMRSINWQSPAASRFPDWLSTNQGLNSTPRFQARPASNATHYHWHDWSNPLFVAHPDDQGLRWDLIDWRDNP